MPRVFVLSLVFLLMTSFSFSEQEDKLYGPNSLRHNTNVSLYLDNDRGIPLFVAGNLADQIFVKSDYTDAIYQFLEKNRGAYKMDRPRQEMQTGKQETDEIGMTHIRLTQNYKRIPVIGGQLIAHFTANGALKTVNGHYFPEINIDVTPAISADEAAQLADEHLQSFWGKGLPKDAPQLVVFPFFDDYYLCWRTFLYSDTPMGRWEIFVDAHSGEIIFSANRIMNANDIGTGYGVMGDFRDTIETNLNGSVYEMRDYTRRLNNNPHGHDGQMASNSYIQTNIAGSSLPGSIATDADNFWDDASTQRPAVDGQVYSGLVYDYFLHHLGRNGFDDNGSTMLTSVNYYAEGNNNAYWNGSQIVVWSWSSGWRSLAGCPDVIAHEWGHAVTEHCANLVYQLEPGALNESFSDMMGAAFEFYYPDYDTPDWLMGENGQTSGAGFRSMENPHLYGDPDYYGTSDPYWYDVNGCSPSYLNDYCGVHTNSGVGNKWFFLFSDGGVHHNVTVTGIGVQDAIKVAYRANRYYWNSNTDYHEAALGTISAAFDLDPSGVYATQAANAWNAVGVTTPGPSLVFDYPGGIPTVLTPNVNKTFEVVISGALGGTLVAGSPQIHYSLDGAAYQDVTLTQVSSTRFQALLPGTDCGSYYDFYFSAEEASTGMKYDPDPSQPNHAVAADSVVTVMDDNFESDQGWSVSGNASAGQWNRGIPVGGGDRGDPADDYDGSGRCYLTGNTDGDSDVDVGYTYLDSPTFDLTDVDAVVKYARWYSNDYGNAPLSDVFRVFVSNDNGSTWVKVDSAGPIVDASGGWNEHSFVVSDYVTPSALMKVRFEASDVGDGSVVEAAVDAFQVKRYACDTGPAPLEITTDALADWTAGVAYNAQLSATGGVGNYIWSDAYGDLAGTGLTLNGSGVLAGTPISGGVIAFTALVTDDVDSTDSKQLGFLVNAAPEITTSSLPDWTAGHPYSQQFAATGGTAPTAWSDKNGDLAGTGLTLSSTGLLSGTPNSAGIIAFTARIVDNVGGSDEQLFNVQINGALIIQTLSLPDWTVGLPYSQVLDVIGGTGTALWSDKNSDLDGTGLNLDPTGALTGTPTAQGEIIFTARAVDQVGASSEKTFTFTVNPAVAITTASLPAWTAGVPYSQQLEATGGTGAKNWSDEFGDLSGSGLGISASGLIDGTPAASGQIDFTAQVSDAVGSSDDQAFAITINPPVSITTDQLPDAEIDAPYSYQLATSGGTGDITWTDRDGDLSGTGYTLADDGALTGTTDTPVVITFFARATDAVGALADQELTLTVVRPYVCGDANGDGNVNVGDAVFVVNFVFNGGNAPNPEAAGDANCDGLVNIGDGVYVINFVFKDGEPPCCP